MPQPEQVIEARSEQTRDKLKAVDKDVLYNFETAADKIIEDCDGDCRKALLKSLALITGHD